MKALKSALFGVCTFCACSHHHDECGANGLPLTPSSVKILGRFQELKTIQHPYLCQYIDVHRGKHERIIYVSEYYQQSLRTWTSDEEVNKEEEVKRILYGILCGLSYLHDHGIVHRCLTPENILLDEMGDVRLFNYGLYYMTGFGSDVAFPIGSVQYLPPDVISNDLHSNPSKIPAAEDFGEGPGSICPCSSSVDVWSLGVIILELLVGESQWNSKSVKEITKIILNLARNHDKPQTTAIDLILKEQNCTEQFNTQVSPEFQDLLKQCLTIDNSKRPTVKHLLKLPMFNEVQSSKNGFCDNSTVLNGGTMYMFSPTLRCANLDLPTSEECTDDYLSERSLEEVYYLWRLAGGDLEFVLKKSGMLRSKPAVSRLVNFVLETGEVYGEMRDSSILRDTTVVILPMDQLRQRLSGIDPMSYYPLLENEFQPSTFTSFTKDFSVSNRHLTMGRSSSTGSLPHSSSSLDLAETSRLPLVIKEKDVEWQFHRIVLYERLLKGYPYMKQQIWKEARIDIPPLYRAYTWAAVLEVQGDVRGRYDAIDKESPISTDRQIEVDIPRCHQYNAILSSPQGHRKLKRVLKAWVVSHPEYVYWQGLDSLCAPFLCLNFNDEALAFACLDKFIPKYLHKFFLKDNSAVIQEYLAVFAHLVAFHDPELHNHLHSIDFIPDLYAIPWFLTMFAHAFPIHKLYHLWDTLLLGNSSFPLFIGVAILYQFRDQLLSFGFNDCILHFSDMPEIDIEKCVEDSVRLFCSTPKSAAFRLHAKNATYTTVSASTGLSTIHKPPDQLVTDPVLLHDLKTEKCCRISASDLVDLKELLIPNGEASPYRKTKSGKSKVLVIDCRSKEEFQRGAFPDSINVPFESAFAPDGKVNFHSYEDQVNSSRSLVKAIVSNREHQAVKFAENLQSLKYLKVCVLHKGIDSLRTMGVLVVPPPEL